MGSDLTQQPSMFTTFLCEPIDFISSISSKSWSLASSSVESLHERKNIGPVIYTKTNLDRGLRQRLDLQIWLLMNHFKQINVVLVCTSCLPDTVYNKQR